MAGEESFQASPFCRSQHPKLRRVRNLQVQNENHMLPKVIIMHGLVKPFI